MPVLVNSVRSGLMLWLEASAGAPCRHTAPAVKSDGNRVAARQLRPPPASAPLESAGRKRLRSGDACHFTGSHMDRSDETRSFTSPKRCAGKLNRRSRSFDTRSTLKPCPWSQVSSVSRSAVAHTELLPDRIRRQPLVVARRSADFCTSDRYCVSVCCCAVAAPQNKLECFR